MGSLGYCWWMDSGYWTDLSEIWYPHYDLIITRKCIKPDCFAIIEKTAHRKSCEFANELFVNVNPN
jgi:hypothetical protein